MNVRLEDFARSLFDRFESAGVPLLLAGGWAVTAHGFPRNTLDLDWVCQRSMEAQAVDLMHALGFVARSSGMATRFQYARELCFPFVDLIWVNDGTFGRLRGEIDAVMGVRVVTFQGLIAMKLHALRDDERRKGRDLRDLQELLERNPGKIGEMELRAMCLKYAGEGAFDMLRYRR
jgi:hypothetical protein